MKGRGPRSAFVLGLDGLAGLGLLLALVVGGGAELLALGEGDLDPTPIILAALGLLARKSRLVARLAARLLSVLYFLVIIIVGAGAPRLPEAEPVVELAAEAVVAVDLLELLTEALLGLGRGEHDLELLDGLAHLHLVAGVVLERDAEHLAHLAQLLDGEVAVLVGAARGPAEGGLEREGVDELELLPHDDAARGLLLLLDLEVAEVEVEEVGVLLEEQGEYALLEAVCALVRAAVHEEVLAARVAVDVAVEEDVAALQRLPHHHLGRAVLGAHLHAGRDPLSVQVQAAQRGAVVADQYAVGVQHGDDLEHEVVSQVARDLVVRHQELQHPVDDERGVALARVDPARYYYSSPDRDLFRPRAEVCDDRHLAVVPCDRLAHDRLPNPVLRLRLAQPL
mmetsp:Transcript_13579/g.23113  ORF Transcript_13579/g.23113 Transcript_13579/m.23113 type:complete len:396 (-) Transcript_13579:1175-2362(-)